MLNQTEIDKLKQIQSLEDLEDLQSFIVDAEKQLMDKQLSKANHFKLDIPLKDKSIASVVAVEFAPGWCYHKSVVSYGKGYWTISYINTAQALCTAKKAKILDAVKKFQEVFTQEDNKTLCNEIESNLRNGHKELAYINKNLLDKLREVHKETH